MVKGRWLPRRGRLTRWASAMGYCPLSPGQTSASKTRMISLSVGVPLNSTYEAKSAPALFVDKLQRCNVRLIGADLAVANHTIASELEPGDLIARNAHSNPVHANDISLDG